MMTIEQLNHFYAAYKFRNFTVAANSMFLHHSTVSKSVSALEAELGGALFFREKNGLVPTELGEALEREARPIPLILASLKERAAGAHSIRGEIRIAALEGLVKYIAQPYAIFQTESPNVVWNSSMIPTVEKEMVAEQVKEGKFDIAILPRGEFPEDEEALAFTTICNTDFVVLLSPEHPMAGQRTLENETLLQIIPMHISSLLMGKGLEALHLVHTGALPGTSNEEFDVMQVAAGFGIMIMPRIRAESYGAVCAVRAIEDFGMDVAKFSVCALWRWDNPDRALKRFVEILHTWRLQNLPAESGRRTIYPHRF